MASTSSSCASASTGDVISSRVVTGRRQRRFSSPALPTQQIQLESDPHDTSLARRSVEELIERTSPVETMAERAARWRAQAAYHLAHHPPASVAFAEAMRLENHSLQPVPAGVLSRQGGETSRRHTRMPGRRGHARQEGQSLRMPRPLPTKDMARPGRSLGVEQPRQSRATVDVNRAAVVESQAINGTSPEVQENRAPSAAGEMPAGTIDGPSTPEPTARSRTVTPGSVLLGPSPSRPRDIAQETVEEDAAKKGVKRDSYCMISAMAKGKNLVPEAVPATDGPQDPAPTASSAEGIDRGGVASVEEGDDGHDIAETYLAYMVLTQRERSVSRGRSRRREDE